ncbi:MAG: hypothetical protein AAGE99_04855 [Chlamydiota bacterium]
MISLTNIQKTVIEPCLYLFGAGLLWKGRKVALRDPLTAQYGALAISHVVFSTFIRLAVDNQRQEEKEQESEENLTNRLGSITLGTVVVLASTFVLRKKFDWIQADAKAFVGVTATSLLSALLIHFIPTKPENKNKPLLIDKEHLFKAPNTKIV